MKGKPFECSGTIHGCKRIKIVGCPACGSEFTEAEKEEALKENVFNDDGEQYTCPLCESVEPLEDLGEEYDCHLIKD